MTSLTQIGSPVHLRFDDGKVFITPDDHPRFIMAAKRAVKILQRDNAIEEKLRRFNDEYLPQLYQWCLDRRGKVRACYLGAPTPHGLTVFVIAATEQYDFELGDEISQFALRLEREGWSSNILQIPHGEEEDLRTFFKAEKSLEIYAQTKAAPGEGGS
ncbi:MAG: hypothetical protein ACRELG_25715 [Gemmataceae bacterium]